MPELKLYNTASGRIEPFRPASPGRVGIYVCGTTVYDYPHIGHARTYVVFDVLLRYLRLKGYNVKMVENFTDVEDKIISRARELKIHPLQLAEKFIQQYFRDFDALNIERRDQYPKASEHITEMQQIISALIEKGYAYTTATGVYFDISKFHGYGQISRKKIDELLAGARVEPDPTKRAPLDFALWKYASDDPVWNSPWGQGRPGWHIECSAMALKYLGEVDLHGGGSDLIFPHHENEAAQSEAYTGKPSVRHWMHVEWVQFSGEKMSKSLGNVVRVEDALAKWGANPVRLYLIQTHYRKQIEFSEEEVERAVEAWKLLEEAAWEVASASLEETGPKTEAEKTASKAFQEIDRSLAEDFNTAVAIQTLLRLSRYVRRLASEGRLTKPVAQAISPHWSKAFELFGFALPALQEEERRAVEAIVAERARLRKEGGFAEADGLRQKLREMGFELSDHGDRTVWRKVQTGGARRS